MVFESLFKEGKAIDWENILANEVSDKGLIYRIFKEVSEQNSKKNTPNNPFRQLAKDKHFLKEDIQMLGKDVQYH